MGRLSAARDCDDVVGVVTQGKWRRQGLVEAVKYIYVEKSWKNSAALALPFPMRLVKLVFRSQKLSVLFFRLHREDLDTTPRIRNNSIASINEQRTLRSRTAQSSTYA